MAAPQFGLMAIRNSRYDYQRQTFTFGPVTLSPGVTTVFDVTSWNPSDVNDKLIILDSIAASQYSDVQILYAYDGVGSDPSQGWTDAMPAGYRPYRTAIMARESLSLSLVNVGAPKANFQLNYTVAVRRMPVAEEKMRGYQPSEVDLRTVNSLPSGTVDGQTLTSIQQLDALVRKGTLPHSPQQFRDALWFNRLTSDGAEVLPRHVTTASGTSTTAWNVKVPAGSVSILESLAVEGAPAGITLSIDVDDVQQHCNVNGAAFVHADDTPWVFWVPAIRNFKFNLTGATGTFLVRPGIRTYYLSDLLRLHLGIATGPATNYAKVKAGFQ